MYSKMMVLRFPKEIVNQAIVVRLVKDYDLSFNILKATISPKKEGLMVMELSGHRKNFTRGMNYLKECGVLVKTIGQEVSRNDERCYQCGACTAVCHTGALHIDPETQEVIFEADKCSACELCVSACPARAMEVHLNSKVSF